MNAEEDKNLNSSEASQLPANGDKGEPKNAKPSKKSKSAIKESKEPSNELSAIIRFRGQQFKVFPGANLTVNRIDAEPGTSINIEEVLALSSSADGQSTVLVGNPLVSGAKVAAKIVSHSKGPKVLVFKKKRRKGYTKSQGHRQLETKLLIEEIVATR